MVQQPCSFALSQQWQLPPASANGSAVQPTQVGPIYRCECAAALQLCVIPAVVAAPCCCQRRCSAAHPGRCGPAALPSRSVLPIKSAILYYPQTFYIRTLYSSHPHLLACSCRTCAPHTPRPPSTLHRPLQSYRPSRSFSVAQTQHRSECL